MEHPFRSYALAAIPNVLYVNVKDTAYGATGNGMTDDRKIS